MHAAARLLALTRRMVARAVEMSSMRKTCGFVGAADLRGWRVVLEDSMGVVAPKDVSCSLVAEVRKRRSDNALLERFVPAFACSWSDRLDEQEVFSGLFIWDLNVLSKSKGGMVHSRRVPRQRDRAALIGGAT